MEFVRRSPLQSKVARRILLLFIVSSLLPVGVLAGVVLTAGSQRLREEAVHQLQRNCKARAMAAYERLQLLDAEMRMAIVRGSGAMKGVTGGDLESRTIELERVHADQPADVASGPVRAAATITDDQWSHLGEGKPLIVTSADEGGRSSTTYLVRAADAARARDDTVWAKIDVDDLLDFETLHYARRVAILDARATPMSASVAAPASMTAAARDLAAQSSRRVFAWKEGEERYLGTCWYLLLKVEFGAPGWTFVLSESQGSMDAPIIAFEQALILSIVLSLAVISLLSIVLIRRTLGPIARLRDGTKKLTAQDFDHRVDVRSGDEFEELAHSFNTMAERTGDHLRALQTMGDVQQAILATLKKPEIVASFLQRVPELIDCLSCGVILVKPGTDEVESFHRIEGAAPSQRTARLPSSLLASLGPDVPSLLLQGPQPEFGLLAEFTPTGANKLILLPIHIEERLEAIVVAGCERGVRPAEDTLARLRGLSGQMAVALAHARLVGELEQLNWGALRALARAIDAKSSWTQGHSDRVTTLAVHMGAALGLGEDELQTLRRGALLHDVGKIGSPASILEKPERLTDEEFEIMKGHVSLGARIVEPIAAFAGALPIVLQHHERLDGTGYPKGLKGEAISYHARIVAVADCFDAMRSDRPYRKGRPIAEALDIIRAEAGRTLDEDAVAALVYVVKNQPDALAEQPCSGGFVMDPVGVER